MEEILPTIETFNTDTFGSWGIGQKISDPEEDTPITTIGHAIDFAIKNKACVIVKPKNGNWYFKGTNNTKSFDVIRNHLILNENNEYHPNTITWLLKY
jgi:hypothetical protein